MLIRLPPLGNDEGDCFRSHPANCYYLKLVSITRFISPEIQSKIWTITSISANIGLFYFLLFLPDETRVSSQEQKNKNEIP